MPKGNIYHYKLKHMEEALLKTGGIPSLAAKILAEAYGHCTPATVRNYLNRFPRLRAAVDRAVDNNLDLAESKLLVAIANGADWAVKFYLETKGKARGYTKRQEIAGVPGQPVVVTDARQWLTEQLDQMESRLRPEPGGTGGPAGPVGSGQNPEKTLH